MKTIGTGLILAMLFGGGSPTAAQERVILGVVQRVQDAFAGDTACAVADAQPLQAFAPEEAVRALSPCAQALSRRYGVEVRAELGMVGIDGGRDKTPGILIRVPGEIDKGCHILMDLSFAIREKRKGRLLGQPAGVWSGDLIEPAPVTAESIPGVPVWLDGPSLRADAKLTKTHMGTQLHVALFDKDDNEVEFDIPATGSAGEAMVTFTKATDEELGPYKVASLESAAPGALKATVASATLPAELEPATLKTVREFLAQLRGKEVR